MKVSISLTTSQNMNKFVRIMYVQCLKKIYSFHCNYDSGTYDKINSNGTDNYCCRFELLSIIS